MQKVENILSKTSSRSPLPTMSPTDSKASRTSLATSSEGADCAIFSMALLVDLSALDTKVECLALTRTSSEEERMPFAEIKSTISDLSASMPL